jgi:hypothetical protein
MECHFFLKRTKTSNFISQNETNNYGNLMSLGNQGLSGIRILKNAIFYELILSFFTKISEHKQ